MSKLALYRVPRDRFISIKIRSAILMHNRLIYQSAPKSDTDHFSVPECVSQMKVFDRNIQTIVRTFQDRGIPVLMGTVPSNLWAVPKTFGYKQPTFLLERKEYGKALALIRKLLVKTPNRTQSSDLENNILRNIAAKYNLPLVDIEKVITEAEPHGVPGETLFFDNCHLNIEGNYLLSSALEEAILQFHSPCLN